MIKKDMTPLDIVEKYPETEPVFREYDAILGECLLCNYLFDSIEEIAAKSEINIEEMIKRLNKGIAPHH